MARTRGELVPVPCAAVAFPSGFVARLERLVASRTRARGALELAGAALVRGQGHDLVGHRAYREGDDPRAIDWATSARGEELLVRITRREAGARWRVLVDTSRSMGVGPPGKLQRAAEIAAGVGALGIAAGAHVTLCAAGAAFEAVELAKRSDLPRALRFLEARIADGVFTREALRRAAAPACARLVLVSDLFGLEPRDCSALARPGRTLDVACVLAPQEMHPRVAGSVAWRDAEREARVEMEVDERARSAYELALSALLERWRTSLRVARARFALVASPEPFEAALARLP